MALRTLAGLLVVGIGCADPAGAASIERPQAQLTWRVAFGAGTGIDTGYGVSLRQGSGEFADVELLTFDVSGGAALARVAGVPLLQRRQALAQNDDAAISGGAEETTPWYAQQWVWWTAGGLAATAALVGSSGGGDESSEDLTVRTGSACVFDGGNVLDNELDGACVPEEEVECPEGVDECSGWAGRKVRAAVSRDPAHDAWLDAGAGHMGDLLAR